MITILLPLILSLLSFPVAALVLPQSILPAAFGVMLVLNTELPPSEKSVSEYDGTIPVLEVVKIYGKIAGTDCYGKQAPKGSSCQIKRDDVQRLLYDTSSSSPGAAIPSATMKGQKSNHNFVSREAFATKLQGKEFRWPLKPFGIDGSPSLAKTAVMNKGAETRVFMEELEARKLYDPRNPTGPLPTSLRPAVNQQLQAEGILDRKAIDRAYDVLVGWSQSTEPTTEYLDYYEFLKMFGPNSVSWPK